MTSAANTGNAIERIRDALSNPKGSDDEFAALAAVDALYQTATETVRYRGRSLEMEYPATAEALDALAAAVRRVKGD